MKAGDLDSVQLSQIHTYATWNIWKERCRPVFDNKYLPVRSVGHANSARSTQSQLASTSTKEAMQMYKWAL